MKFGDWITHLPAGNEDLAVRGMSTASSTGGGVILKLSPLGQHDSRSECTASVLICVFERYGGGGGRPKENETACLLLGWMYTL